jgi:hypothetical protein
VTTGDAFEPYRVVGPGGEVVEPVSVFLRDLLAARRSGSTLRSYADDLLRWWRFLDAVGVGWDRASRVEARDFSCWIQLTAKQRLQTSRPRAARLSSRTTGAPNAVTGKPAAGDGYAPSTVANSETALRRFYDCHRDGGTGPVLPAGRGGGRMASGCAGRLLRVAHDDHPRGVYVVFIFVSTAQHI